MEFPWQDIAALTLVTLAAGHLALRGWRLFVARRGGQHCNSCGGCSGAAAKELPLISLNLPERSFARTSSD